MMTCKSLETVEWFFGRRTINSGNPAQQALWLWRRVKQRSKRRDPQCDGTMTRDDVAARSFIVGDLMAPSTPRESRRLHLTSLVGRAGDLEARLL